MVFPQIEGYKIKKSLNTSDYDGSEGLDITPSGSRDVYLAKRTGLDVDVVLKLFRTLDRHPYVVKARQCISIGDSLRQEGQITLEGRLRGIENIVHYIDHGFHEDRLYIVEEHIDGNPVTDRYQNLTDEESLSWFMQMLDGVEHIHNQRIIIGDLKLKNMLATNDSPAVIKLTDFEFAYREEDIPEDVPLNFFQHLMPRRTRAPEIFQGSTISYATDLYSLGCCLLYLLTKQNRSVEQINQLPAEYYESGLDDMLNHFAVERQYYKPLRQALAHNPSDRFSNVAEMRAAVQEAENSVAGRDYTISDDEALLDIYRSLGDERHWISEFGEIVRLGTEIQDIVNRRKEIVDTLQPPGKWHDNIYLVCERRGQVEGFLRMQFVPASGKSLVAKKKVIYDCALAHRDNESEIYGLLIRHADERVMDILDESEELRLTGCDIEATVLPENTTLMHAVQAAGGVLQPDHREYSRVTSRGPKSCMLKKSVWIDGDTEYTLRDR